MSLQVKPDFVSLQARFGQTALQGETVAEKKALQVGLFLTIVFTGEQVCSSLTKTAIEGGC